MFAGGSRATGGLARASESLTRSLSHTHTHALEQETVAAEERVGGGGILSEAVTESGGFGEGGGVILPAEMLNAVEEGRERKRERERALVERERENERESERKRERARATQSLTYEEEAAAEEWVAGIVEFLRRKVPGERVLISEVAGRNGVCRPAGIFFFQLNPSFFSPGCISHVSRMN